MVGLVGGEGGGVGMCHYCDKCVFEVVLCIEGRVQLVQVFELLAGE